MSRAGHPVKLTRRNGVWECQGWRNRLAPPPVMYYVIFDVGHSDAVYQRMFDLRVWRDRWMRDADVIILGWGQVRLKPQKQLPKE